MKQFILFNKLRGENLERIKGTLYSKKGDFVVQEINQKERFFSINFKELNFPEGKKMDFVKCILVKKGISTFQAVSELGKILGIKKEEIGYHGLKDTFWITSQEISIPTKNFLESFNKLKQKRTSFFIKLAVFVNEPCKLRDIQGNHFCITIRDSGEKSISELSHLNVRNIPNFYGHQRFGVRQNMHLVGKELVKKDYEEALKIFCIDSKNEHREIEELRKNLVTLWGDWEKCAEIVRDNPYFKNEIKIFSHLMKNKYDYVEALNQTGLTLFLVNSYSSYFFNKVLTKILSDKINLEFLPVIGYGTKFNNSEVEKEYRKLMAQEGISLGDFFNKNYEELSYVGRDKKAKYSIEDFSFREGYTGIILEFSLPMGVYANLFLDRIIENKSGEIKLE